MPGRRLFSGILFPAAMAMIGAVTAISFATYWRIERVQANVAAVNRFYVPVLRHLGVMSGKWQAYQRSFEQIVGFRRWGRAPGPAGAKLRLRKMIEPDLEAVSRALRPEAIAAVGGDAVASSAALKGLIGKLEELSARESARLTEIAALVHGRRFEEAGAAYARARSEHLAISEEIVRMTRDCETRVDRLQSATEEELRDSQSVMLLLLAGAVVLSLLVLIRLKRWMDPVVEWTRVAKEIALHGIHGEVRFPEIRRDMPPEIALLTSEFTRMGKTLLERDRVIHQQRDKLEAQKTRLTEQNELLRRLGVLNERVIRNMSQGLLVVGADGAVEQFNASFCSLLGADARALLGMEARQALSAWPAEQVAAWLEQGGAGRPARVRLGARVFNVSVTPLHEGVGRVLIFEDITQLEHAGKLVAAGNLSGQVAHEVRNPLNAMTLQLEMLAEDLAAASCGQALPRVSVLEEQVRRLDRITRKYLDMGSSRKLAIGRVEAHDLVERCLAFLSGEIQAARVRVELDLGAARGAVKGDADALFQVLLNLIRNSLEALGDRTNEPCIRIQSAVVGEGFALRVSDNGPGIAPEVASKLFEPFVTSKTTGTGLGLSLSRQICMEHGGDLRIIETGRGAVFEVIIQPWREEAVQRDAHPDC